MAKFILGSNHYEQCDIPEIKDVIAISAGQSHSLALDKHGKVYAWGSNEFGQYSVTDMSVVAIAAGWEYSLALDKYGRINVCDFEANFGFSSNSQSSIPNVSDVVTIYGGSDHSLAIDKHGKIHAWGHNDCGQCDIPDIKNVVAISAGFRHSVAIINRVEL